MKNFLIAGFGATHHLCSGHLDHLIWHQTTSGFGVIWKKTVYSTPVASIQQLRARIEAAFQAIRQDTINRVITSYERRLRSCVEVGGGHVEIAY